MKFTGRQKAAMLLASLDSSTALELLKGLDEHTVKDIAVEIAYLDAAGKYNLDSAMEFAQEFCRHLEGGGSVHTKSFIDKLLKASLGDEKTKALYGQLENLLSEKDPFIQVKKADDKLLAAVLNSEHPQAAAVVLGELDAKRSSNILGQLKEQLRLNVLGRMTGSEATSADAKRRIAASVCQKLMQAGVDASVLASADGSENYRKVAVILRNLAKDLRDAMLASLGQNNQDICKQITDLMIIWDDIPLVADRSLQEAFRNIEPKTMALALIKADEKISAKIKANISERAKAAIDEETSLLSSPRKEEINGSREQITAVLKEMNGKGELNFAE